MEIIEKAGKTVQAMRQAIQKAEQGKQVVLAVPSVAERLHLTSILNRMGGQTHLLSGKIRFEIKA